VAPARLGTPFRWLLGSSWVSNIGDGVIVSAGPLLVASETRDPFLVALAWMLQYLPWLIFGLFAGVVADRVNRKVLITVANCCRVVVLSVLVTTIVTGQVDIVIVLGAMFLLGVGETFADTTTATLLPMVVAKKDLGIGNARMLAGTVTLNQLAGPPIGALLFGLGRSWPFFTQVVCILVSILLVLRVQLPAHGRTGDQEPTSVRTDIVE
jgi:fucose permease